MSITNTVFPFTIPSEDRKVPLKRRVELAAVFSLAELTRDKGGGLISKKPAEEMLFISELHYPFWFVPWRGRTLLFDGFDLKSHTISFSILPDSNVFIQEMKGSSRKLETYSAFLSHNSNYFEKFSGKSQKLIKGLIMDKDLMSDIFSILPRAKRAKDLSKKVTLPLVMDYSAVKSSIGELQRFEKALENDVKRLSRIAKMLMKTTERHISAVKLEVEKIKRQSDAEVSNLTSKIVKKTEEIRKTYDEKILKVSEETDLKIQTLSGEGAELQAERDRLKTYIEECKSQASMAHKRRDEKQEEYWNRELKASRLRLLQIGKRLKEIEGKIKEINSMLRSEISRFKSEYASEAEKYMAEVKRLEATRDAKIRIRQEAIESLEKLTSRIIRQINGMIEARNLALKEIREMGYPLRKRRITLARMPFFLVCYTRDLKKRYVVFPSSTANTMGGVSKIKSALRPYAVRSMLQEYSVSITNLLNEFVNSIQRNSMLEDRVLKICVKTNVLKKRFFRREVEKGLQELSEEGWLSSEELQTLVSRLNEIAR